jgi:hypothetical protein
MMSVKALLGCFTREGAKTRKLEGERPREPLGRAMEGERPREPPSAVRKDGFRIHCGAPGGVPPT